MPPVTIRTAQGTTAENVSQSDLPYGVDPGVQPALDREDHSSAEPMTLFIDCISCHSSGPSSARTGPPGQPVWRNTTRVKSSIRSVVPVASPPAPCAVSDNCAVNYSHPRLALTVVRGHRAGVVAESSGIGNPPCDNGSGGKWL